MSALADISGNDVKAADLEDLARVATAEVECTWCGEKSADRYEHDGKPICYECHHREFEFPCCRCEEYGDVDDQHVLLVVGDAAGAGLDRAGIYRITMFPYYRDGMTEGSLIETSLDWAAPLPPDLEAEEMHYPCGYLCADCQAEVGPTWRWLPVELARAFRALRKLVKSAWQKMFRAWRQRGRKGR